MTNNGLAGSFYDAKYILVNSKVLRLDHGNMWKCKISFSGTSNLLPLFNTRQASKILTNFYIKLHQTFK